MKSLENKTILISGASAGIGMACAKVFAEVRCKIILLARRIDRLKAISSELIDEFDTQVHPVEVDIRSRDQINETIDSLPIELSNIDILINNAGLARGLAPIQSADIQDWEEMIDTNIKGLLYLTRRVVPGMIERGFGHVINIGSIAGREVYPNGGVYCSTKFAVHALTKSLAIDLLNTPVRVSTVDPGLVETEFSQVRFRGDKSRAEEVYLGMTPLTGLDVAEAVLWTASRPEHVNVAEMVILPADQVSAQHVKRET